eukprot:359820-Chlamydomonas_euryale.AAC.2
MGELKEWRELKDGLGGEGWRCGRSKVTKRWRGRVEVWRQPGDGKVEGVWGQRELGDERREGGRRDGNLAAGTT